MYKSFYNLDSTVFAPGPDPLFTWFGKGYREALSLLKYGVHDNKGFLLLTGGVGTGKTILINAFVRGLDENTRWVVIPDPRLERIAFYNDIARGFGIKKQCASKVQFLIRFSHYLHNAHDRGQKVVLLIDDCHLLSQEMLEELRLLSNIEKEDARLINIFFIGQPEFNTMLARPKNRAIRQRLALKAELGPLDRDETGQYIEHRLKIAGAETRIFSRKAIKVIHRYSGGIPAQINTICSRALLHGSKRSKATINHNIITACGVGIGLHENVEGGERDKAGQSPPGMVNHRGGRIAGFNLESEKSSGVAVGLFLLLFFVLCTGGGYYWFSIQQPVNEKQLPPVLLETPRIARSLPAVVSTDDEISKNVMEKTEKAERTGDMGGIADSPAKEIPTTVISMSEETEVDINDQSHEDGSAAVENIIATQQEEELTIDIGEGTVAAVPVDTDEFTVVKGDDEPVVALPPTQEDVIAQAPFEPKKIILPLQANSVKLTRDAARRFDELVQKLADYPRATLLVKGFVSAKTNSPENQRLSKERALNIRKLLLSRGIAEENIRVRGMGNREPLQSNDTYAGRKKNRRVEIIILDDGL